eukprot:4637644-Prymnesium_polylepis.2
MLCARRGVCVRCPRSSLRLWHVVPIQPEHEPAKKVEQLPGHHVVWWAWLHPTLDRNEREEVDEEVRAYVGGRNMLWTQLEGASRQREGRNEGENHVKDEQDTGNVRNGLLARPPAICERKHAGENVCSRDAELG